MKLGHALGLAVLSAVTLSAAASAQRGLTTRQVGHPPPAGLGSYGNVGMPYPPPYYSRPGHVGGFTSIYAGYAGPSQQPVTRPQFRRRGGYGFYPPYVGGWSSGMIEDPERYRDAAYFAGSADSWHDGGRAHYDYDRAYPYDWYRDTRRAIPIADARATPDTALRCSDEGGVRVCRGRR